jgi:hypothetical protein
VTRSRPIAKPANPQAQLELDHMKKLVLPLSCILAIASAAFAQSTLSTNQLNYDISGTSGMFNVTFTLSTTQANISSWDLFLQSNSIGANQFTITSNTPLNGADTPAVSPRTPSSFATDNSFLGSPPTLVNDKDQGWGWGAADQTISDGSIDLVTLQFTYNFSSPPTVGDVLTFSTTPSGSGSPAYNGTYFYSNDFGTFNAIPQDSFTVTVVAVPEPSTWLAGIVAAAVIGITMLRRRATR